MKDIKHVKVRRTDEGFTLVVPVNDQGIIDNRKVIREIGTLVEALALSSITTSKVVEDLTAGARVQACRGLDFQVEQGDTLHLLIFHVDGCQSEVVGYHSPTDVEDAYWQYWSDSEGIERGDHDAVEAVVTNGRTFVEWTSVEIQRPEVLHE